MTDLESRIFLAIAGAKPSQQLAAVLAEIALTHAMIERDKAIHLFNVLMAANKPQAAMYLHAALGLAEDQSIDTLAVRHDAAESDTSETTS